MRLHWELGLELAIELADCSLGLLPLSLQAKLPHMLKVLANPRQQLIWLLHRRQKFLLGRKFAINASIAQGLPQPFAGERPSARAQFEQVLLELSDPLIWLAAA